MYFVIAIALLFVLSVGGLVLYSSFRPDTFKVERTAVIGAPMARVYAAIEDLAAWQAWSPWAKKDPAAKAEYSGPATGLGAAFAWDGNKDVGKGRMEIVEAVPPSRVKFRLDFEKPFKGTNESTFVLRTVRGGTEVTWTMTGPSTLLTKVMDVLMNMDRMIGRDFEAGLAAMKQVCERPAV